MQPMLFAAPKPPGLRSRGIDLRCCDVMEMLGSLPGGAADLVLSDPPWGYDNGQNGRASEHYACLPMSEIREHVAAAHRVAKPNSYLALWCTFPFLQDWMRAELPWEFVSGGAWVKTGMPGVGFHWRGNAEVVLLYKKGKPKPVSSVALLNAHVTNRHSDGTPGNSGVLHSRKPVEWQRGWLESWVPPRGLVVDLYAGLGSVAEAVLLAGEGRTYVGAEVSEERHAAACALLAQVRA